MYLCGAGRSFDVKTFTHQGSGGSTITRTESPPGLLWDVLGLPDCGLTGNGCLSPVLSPQVTSRCLLVAWPPGLCRDLGLTLIALSGSSQDGNAAGPWLDTWDLLSAITAVTSFKGESSGSDAQRGLGIRESGSVGAGRVSGEQLDELLEVQMGRWVPEGQTQEVATLCHFKYFCKS